MAKIKVGNLVNIKPHITGNRVLVMSTSLGIVTSALKGHGYYEVILDNGVKIMTSYANLEVVSENEKRSTYG